MIHDAEEQHHPWPVRLTHWPRGFWTDRGYNWFSGL